jgi:acetylornithine deacetylase/succinyl-diaminopimelate desuccinylase-like protein
MLCWQKESKTRSLRLPAEAHRYIDQKFATHLERTRVFLRQPSISSQNTGILQSAEILQHWLADAGACVEVHGEDYPLVYAEWLVGAPKTLLVYGMYDVQPVDGQDWTAPPFAAEIRPHGVNGPCIFARGACNSKGPLMAFLHAIEACSAVGRLPVNIKWTIEGEEEIGSIRLPEFYRENRARLKADGAFEPFWSQWRQGCRPEISLGSKGDLSMEIICRSGEWGGPREIVHSSLGPWIKSPAWRLVRALASMIDEQQDFKVDGVPRYGAITAEDEEMLAALAQDFDTDEVLANIGASRFRRNLPPLELLRQEQFATALNINGFISGYTGPGSHTIIPNVARAKLDIRIPPGVTIAQVRDAIRSHLDRRGFEDLETSFDSGYPAVRTSLGASVVQAWLRTYRAHGFEPVIQPLEASATPYYVFTDLLGLPYAWGGLGAAGGSHGPDEWCSVAGLKDMEKSLATYLFAFSEMP